MMSSAVRQVALLAALSIYTSFSTIVTKQSRSKNAEGQELYSITAAVFLSEALKLAVSVVLVAADACRTGQDGSIALPLDSSEKRDPDDCRQEAPKLLRRVYRQCNTEDAVQMAFPAVLYVLQNVLQLFATAYVSSITYQAIMQLKLLALAALTTTFLRRTVSLQQWACLVVLLSGVFMVGMSKDTPNSASGPSAVTTQSSWLAVLSIASISASCVLGSASSVFIESRLKSTTEVSMHARNAQLAFFSLLPAGFSLLLECSQQGHFDILRGFHGAAWTSVIMRSIGGFLVAAVLKYTEAIYKGISSSVAIILTIVIEAALLGQPLSATVVLGALIVSLSSALYFYTSKQRR